MKDENGKSDAENLTIDKLLGRKMI